MNLYKFFLVLFFIFLNFELVSFQLDKGTPESVGMSSKKLQSINNIFEVKLSKDNTSISRSYKILGLSENVNLEEVSIQYKKLVKQYHPDRLQGMGLPKEFIELANQKLTAINKAYNKIKNNEKKN